MPPVTFAAASLAAATPTTAPAALVAATDAVHADLRALVAELAAGDDPAGRATAQFLSRILDNAVARGSQTTMNVMARLPLLVHGAETGDPGGGRAAAVVHLLWWTSARFLDDLADDGPTDQHDAAANNRGILAALAAGTLVPVRVVDAAGAGEAVRRRVLDELVRGWWDAIGGQLRDYDTRPAVATTESVLASYAGKTGAPYAMAAAMAAHAAGVEPARVERWRAVGARFGVLRQLVNDQRDLVTGKDEDLANGTATYLVAYLLSAVGDRERAALLDLHAAARESAPARAEFKARMLRPEIVGGYHRQVDAMVARVHADLTALGGTAPYPDQLHAMVDEAMRPFPLPTGTTDDAR